jgi:ABC-type Mn2+/Zn2+ transport system ATPase subunit
MLGGFGMAQRAGLLVVVVRDAALRHVLAEQLAGRGIRLLSPAAGDGHLLRRRLIREPELVLLDEAGLAGDPGDWIETRWIQEHWRRVTVLTIEHQPGAASDAASELGALFSHWDGIDIP